MKKRVFIINIILIIGILFSSCSKVIPLDKEKVEENVEVQNDNGKKSKESLKDEFNIPLTKIDTLDPLENKKADYDHFINIVYDSLFEFDEELQVIPVLVEKYEIIENGKTIEIQLKDNIYWHNGNKLTSEDVVFTIEKLKEAEDSSIYKDRMSSALSTFSKDNIENKIRTKIIDERKIVIYFDKIYGNNLESLTFPIVCKDSYISEDDYQPIGTGPFIFKNYNNSQGITLFKNDKYWDGQVNISKINGKIFENEDLILNAFVDGRIDFVNNVEVDLERYRKNSYIDILEYLSPEYEFLGFNFNNKILNGEDGIKIRKAIYYAIDRQEIIEKVYLGHATQIDTPFYPNSYLSKEVVNAYGYNPEKAKGLLKEAGFSKLGKDGILKDDFERKLEFSLVTNSSNPYRRKITQMIKENLEEIGIALVLDYPRVDLENLNNEELDSEWSILNKTLKTGKYDLAFLGWELSVISDISFMFHSSFIREGSNLIFYKNSEMDKLLESLYFNNRKGKKDLSENLQEYIMEEIPYASFFFKNKALLFNSSIKGPLEPTYFNPYRNIEKCKILQVKD